MRRLGWPCHHVYNLLKYINILYYYYNYLVLAEEQSFINPLRYVGQTLWNLYTSCIFMLFLRSDSSKKNCTVYYYLIFCILFHKGNFVLPCFCFSFAAHLFSIFIHTLLLFFFFFLIHKQYILFTKGFKEIKLVVIFTDRPSWTVHACRAPIQKSWAMFLPRTHCPPCGPLTCPLKTSLIGGRDRQSSDEIHPDWFKTCRAQHDGKHAHAGGRNAN